MGEQTVNGLQPGDRASVDHLITEEDVRAFANLSGDDNPLHLSRAFADRTSFRGPVAHGMLSAAFVSTLIGKHLPGPGALWLSQSMRFLLPVRVGDTISVVGTVTAVHPSQRLLDLEIAVTNQHGDEVLTGEARVKAVELEVAEAAEPEPQAKVAIVTGASRGIGAATAKRLAEDGWRVALVYRTDQAGADAVRDAIADAGGKAIAICGDVLETDTPERLIREVANALGPVTALVNGAASTLPAAGFEDLSSKEIGDQMRIHLYAPLALIRAALPAMKAAGTGAVVNIGTLAADGAPPPKQLAYAAAKAALASATRSLAVEYGPVGIRFNLVAPGLTETQLTANVPDKTRILTRSQTPLRRLGQPEDVASAIAFLLSDDARHITGETIRINGGLMML